MRDQSVGRDNADAALTRDAVFVHLFERGAIARGSRAEEILRVIAALPPDQLSVASSADRLTISRRTLVRVFREAGLPSPKQWIGLARALHAHGAILRGQSLERAALAAGYHDQFTMSNAIHRLTGLRPSGMRSVDWQHLIDCWIARQHERGAMASGSANAAHR